MAPRFPTIVTGRNENSAAARPEPSIINTPEETLMRIPALAVLTIATVLTAPPARGQTYNPDYPVCLQAYGEKAGYIECGYTSLAQCAQSASGRAAQCFINPYPAIARAPAGRDYRRHRRVY